MPTSVAGLAEALVAAAERRTMTPSIRAAVARDEWLPPSAQLLQLVESLVAKPAEEVLPVLAPLVVSGSAEAARWASEVLARQQVALAAQPVWQRYCAPSTAPALRKQLLEVAARLPREATVRLLAPHLAAENYRVRIAACEVLAACPSASALAALLPLLDSSSTGERDLAIAAVVAIGVEAVPTLLQAAQAKRSNRQLAAVLALSQIPSTVALEAVFDASLSSDPLQRQDARGALVRALSKPAPWAARELDAAGQHRHDELALLACELLVRRLAAGTESERERAIELLAQLSLPQASMCIRGVAEHDPSELLRAQALRIMSRNSDPRALALAFDQLTASDERMRGAAASTIAKVLDASHLAQLQVALRHSDPQVRKTVLWLVGRIAAPAAREVLIAQTGDQDVDVALTASRALERWPRQATDLAWLSALATSSSRGCRQQAARLLGQLASTEAVTLLLTLLEHADDSTRSHAATELGRVDDPRVFEPLFRWAMSQATGGLARSIPATLERQATARWQELLPWLASEDDARKAVAAALLEHVDNAVVRAELRQRTLARDRVIVCNAPDALLDPLDDLVRTALLEMMENEPWGATLAAHFLNHELAEMRGAAATWYRKRGFQVIEFWGPSRR
jgi:HEAT repeat protein